MKGFFLKERSIAYRTNDWSTNRPTLVFIHGLSGSSSAWKRYEEKFLSTYNILSFDLRGHGLSKKYTHFSDYSMKKFSDDLEALFNFLKVDNPIIVSHSFATLIVLEFLARGTSQVRGLVFLSPSFCVRNTLSARIIKPFLTLSRALEILPFSNTPRKRIDYTRFVNTGDWNIPRIIADVGNTTIHVYLYCTLQSYTVNQEDALQHISVPVLIMHGNKDTIFPVDNSRTMAKKIPDSKIIIIDVDHIIVLNRFPEVSSAIEKFIKLL